jgi:aspartyl-tRNA(Asn)/glutamyl-tRNA(Gln) amidotransferase subunit A
MSDPDYSVPSSECSRRAFLEKTFMGAAMAGAMACLVKSSGAPMLNTAIVSDSDDLANLDLHQAAALVRQKKVSPVQLTRGCLARIEAINPKLNAFISVTAESALAEARRAEAELQRGIWKGPLHGIPIALKDLIDTAGVRTTAASALFKDRVPREDAAVVQKLRAAGAVFLGKLNMHEVAFGPTTRKTSFFGPVNNPWATEHITGGSSGGSGAAVAAALCFAALGSDTGGSIRQPAAFCGVVGLMPTYGRVSTRGTLPVSWSADHIGPMTRSVVDAAIVLKVIAGHDPDENTSYDMPVEDYAAGLHYSRKLRMRIGLPRKLFFEALDPDVKRAIENAVSVFVKLGAEIHDVEVPIPSQRAVIQAEAFAYHSETIAKNPELYLSETLSKLRLGASIDMKTYMRARLSLDQLRRTAPRIFKQVDVLLTPTTPVPAPKTNQLPSTFDDVMANDAVMWRNTRPFNLLAFPTISIPCGFTNQGMPIGLQLSAAPWQELKLLKIAYAYQQATSWHSRRPTITAARP